MCMHYIFQAFVEEALGSGYEAKVHALPIPEKEVPEGVLSMDQLPVLADQARSQD